MSQKLKGNLPHIFISNILSRWSYIFSKNVILWANCEDTEIISLLKQIFSFALSSCSHTADSLFIYHLWINVQMFWFTPRLLRDSRFFCITTWNMFLQLFKLCFNIYINSNVIVLQYYYPLLSTNALLVSDSYECLDFETPRDLFVNKRVTSFNFRWVFTVSVFTILNPPLPGQVIFYTEKCKHL